MSLFRSITHHRFYLLYPEYVVRCDHGLDSDVSLCENSIIISQQTAVVVVVFFVVSHIELIGCQLEITILHNNLMYTS